MLNGQVLLDTKEVLRQVPHNAAALVARGFAHARLGHMPQCYGDLNKALKLLRNSPEHDAACLVTRSRILRCLGRCDDAIAEASKALRLNGLDARAYAERGFAHLQAGLMPKAQSDLAKAVNYDRLCTNDMCTME